MRIVSGNTTTYIYVKAVDASDLKTPEVGLAAKFVVKRSRNGGAWTTYTTPTVNATDTGGDGLYELLVDEDTTIDAGFQSQEYLIHMQDTGGRAAPITRVVELYRPPVTAGETLTVVSGIGAVNPVQIDSDTGAANHLREFTNALSTSGYMDSGTVTGIRGLGANVYSIDFDTGAANHLREFTNALASSGYIDTGTFVNGGVQMLADTGIANLFAQTLLDKPAIDGRKVVEVLRLLTAVIGGQVSGAGTGTEVFKSTAGTPATRVTATVDSAGNRLALTYALDT